MQFFSKRLEQENFQDPLLLHLLLRSTTELLLSRWQEARVELATTGVWGYVIIIRFAVWVFIEWAPLELNQVCRFFNADDLQSSPPPWRLKPKLKVFIQNFLNWYVLFSINRIIFLINVITSSKVKFIWVVHEPSTLWISYLTIKCYFYRI